MAINPNISLAGQPLNLQQAVLGGQAIGEGFRNSGVRDSILRQQETMGAQTIQSNKSIQAQKKGAFMNKFATDLMQVPLADRAAIVAQQIPAFEAMGYTAQEIQSQDMSNKGLQGVIAGTNVFAQASGGQDPTAGMQDFQFYQSIINDPNSSPDAVRAAKNKQGLTANAGRLQTNEVSPGVYVDFNSNTGERTDPFRFVNGNRVDLTRDEQLGLKLNESVQAIGTEGAATTSVKVDEQEQLRGGRVATESALANVGLTTDEQQRRQVRGERFIDELSTRNQKAARAQVTLTEAFTLAEEADQGLGGYAKLKLSSIPGLSGIDVSDSAALDSALKKIALDQLQTAFTGPTTDFEFGVVQDVSGSLMGSKAANKARINALKRANWFQQKEFEQARSFTSSGNDPVDFAFNMQEVMTTGKGEYTLQQIQDTAVRNNFSIEQVLEALKK